MEQTHSVLLLLNFLNYAMIILPAISLIVVYSFIFSHWSSRTVTIPFFSDLDPASPESRFSTAIMSIELIIITIILYCRHSVMEILFKTEKRFEKRFKLVYLAMRIINYFQLSGNLMVIVFNYGLNPIAHNIGMLFMYLGYAIYLFIYDIAVKALGKPSRDFSKIVSAVLMVITPPFIFIRFVYPAYADMIIYSISSVLGLITYVCLYLKLFVCKFDLPEFGIRVTKKIPFNN
ncbi:hypothetical protein TVAG_183290 [Trichomonas vaginalis G3]|uniref:CWH43-like N-terminal domain-containing protein n=1 Tax=Trichomonas vaginalis (strain ATCC PRA-98 / G3) TaxID=412133 RepID=A2D967_TRIV3|nr:hypothetical protein TVAGG3_0771400 [Trichomonas vaginalis G3]EAY23093.1 hypothetical protein TVAG_183290 [Trichomonas vaginalis G3]KAI5513851.1 hypothetical protein TVAGG3_0771400 [Trichomonas vaginalis G3]|eukprot:XP_001584079.1 hypothetical protein [Trichomonas vaginalis G3]